MNNFNEWKNHFENNAGHFDHIDFQDHPQLTSSEKKTVTGALQQFQHGENSEGKFLKAHALRFSKDYHDSIVAFIREEQRHSAILGKFMASETIPVIRGHWLDSIFRKIRNLGGIEGSVIVLSSAEIMAMTFYKALKDSTASPTLKAICEQILADETIHIRFQSFSLASIFQGRNSMSITLYRNIHAAVLLCTSVVVWLQYKKVYKAGGYNFRQFAHETAKEYRRLTEGISRFSQTSLHTVRISQ